MSPLHPVEWPPLPSPSNARHLFPCTNHSAKAIHCPHQSEILVEDGGSGRDAFDELVDALEGSGGRDGLVDQVIANGGVLGGDRGLSWGLGRGGRGRQDAPLVEDREFHAGGVGME